MTDWGQQATCSVCVGSGYENDTATTCGECGGAGVVLLMDTVDEDHFYERSDR